MATIGNFQKQADGSYTGSITTLTINAQAVVIRPAGGEGEKAPDYRIFAGQTVLGAAWKKSSREDRPYLSVKLDDPSFLSPVFASLVQSDNGHSLIWSRRSAD